ncbi:amidase [Rhodoligotrophos appendicifer]|uniref:amidase n=1 Tax=Rhodoligotrophos appendicifer TaxID=987056 RepID=UPI001478D564|nr:amidase [Rhodoligotrophos appendicifer]
MDIETYRRLDALEIARRVRSGESDPRDIAACAIATVKARNPDLNAVVLLDEDQALLAAGKVDRTAPLAGVPFLVKDNNLFVEGWPTTFSCRFLEDSPPLPDSEYIRRLRRAGVVLIGKTSTPEFASDWTTEPTLRGPTRNPWNLDRSPGGSSGGSAAAVAGGMVPVAHGNDNAGSIRVPAALCGLFGLKPSRGLVPVGPAFPELAAGLNSEHVLTRTVRDSAAFLDVLAGPEPGAQYQVNPVVASYLAVTDDAPGPLRIGFATERPDGTRIDAEIAKAVRHVAGLLSASGHRLEEIALPNKPCLGLAAEKCWFADIVLLLRQRSRALGREANANEMEAITAFAIERMRGLDAVDYLEARYSLHRIGAEILAEFSPFDAVLTPTTALLAPRIGEFDTRTDAFDYEKWCSQGVQFAPFTDIFNATGQPAASVPAGLSLEGLPIGVQIAAPPGRDDLVLRLSRQIERLLPPKL